MLFGESRAGGGKKSLNIISQPCPTRERRSSIFAAANTTFSSSGTTDDQQSFPQKELGGGEKREREIREEEELAATCLFFCTLRPKVTFPSVHDFFCCSAQVVFLSCLHFSGLSKHVFFRLRMRVFSLHDVDASFCDSLPLN